MDNTLVMLGRVAGILGTLICVFAGAVRVSGAYDFHGFWAGTLLQAGIAGLLIGCFLLLLALVRRR